MRDLKARAPASKRRWRSNPISPRRVQPRAARRRANGTPTTRASATRRCSPRIRRTSGAARRWPNCWSAQAPPARYARRSSAQSLPIPNSARPRLALINYYAPAAGLEGRARRGAGGAGRRFPTIRRSWTRSASRSGGRRDNQAIETFKRLSQLQTATTRCHCMRLAGSPGAQKDYDGAIAIAAQARSPSAAGQRRRLGRAGRDLP